MPIYMVPNPDEMQPGQPGQPPTPQGPSPEASVDYFVKGESFSGPSSQAQVDYFHKADSHPGGANREGFSWGENNPAAGPGAGPHAGIIGPERPNPSGDGVRDTGREAGPSFGNLQGILIGLLRAGVIAILIGLLLPAMFFVFAPVGMANDAANLLMGCATGEHLPGSGDVNGDGPLAVREAAANPDGVVGPSDSEGIIAPSDSDAMISSYSQPLEGILIGLSDWRVGMGSSPFFQGGCSDEFRAEPPPSPTEGAPNASSTDEPTATPTTANTNGNVTTNNNPNGQQITPAPSDPCKDHGGVTYQGTICACPGIMDDVTICADGTQFDNPRPNDTCVPQEVCQQPPSDGGQSTGGGQQPPACEYKCYVPDPNKPEQCLQGGWVYPGTDNACDPNKP